MTSATYKATPETLTDGEQRGLRIDAEGALVVSATGDAAATAWDGVAAEASLTSILKAIYAQNETMIAHLAAIETNTGTP